jgi:hypothetical protein
VLMLSTEVAVAVSAFFGPSEALEAGPGKLKLKFNEFNQTLKF